MDQKFRFIVRSFLQPLFHDPVGRSKGLLWRDQTGAVLIREYFKFFKMEHQRGLKILTAKKENPKADTSQLENEIDQLVYKLYNLTPEEIKIIESGIK